MAIKVLLVEDHAMMRLGLKITIEKSDLLEVVGEADNGKKAVELAETLNPDVILMDIGLPEMDGIEATKIIKEKQLSSRILICTSRENEDDVFSALSAGADGYVMKGINETQLNSAICAVAEGTAWLDPAIAKLVLSQIQKTDNKKVKENNDNVELADYKKYDLTAREYEVLCLIVDGLDNNEISEKLFISGSTAKAHVHNILQKLCLKNKHQATIWAINEGLVKK